MNGKKKETVLIQPIQEKFITNLLDIAFENLPLLFHLYVVTDSSATIAHHLHLLDHARTDLASDHSNSPRIAYVARFGLLIRIHGNLPVDREFLDLTVVKVREVHLYHQYGKL